MQTAANAGSVSGAGPASAPFRFGLGRRMALALIRREVPGWGRIAGAIDITGSGWEGAPFKSVRGKWHGYTMELNLADWSERQTWFLGRYHELDSQLLLDACLRPGDRIIDVGANIGMLTLHAARRVGPGGIVDAFEPNPACCSRIRTALDRNAIKQVRLHPMGLSDSAQTLTLNILENHAGMATLAPVGSDSPFHVTSKIDVPVRIGDEVLPVDDRPLTFLKIDVEGFEVHVLRGLRQTLSELHPIVATEVIAQWLERAGASVPELAGLMSELGYQGYGLGTARKGMRHRLKLVRLGDFKTLPPKICDVVWVPKTGNLRERLEDAIQ